MKSLTTEFWKRYFKVYDALNELIPYQNLLETIIVQSEPKQKDKILDLGSGSGNLAVKFRKFGADVTCIDSSEGAVAIHRQKEPNANILEGDITRKLPFENNYFDIVCSNNVIYTIDREKRRDLFAELYRATKPGGKIIISNLNRGFSPAKIYTDHIKASLKKNGLIKTFWSVLKFIYPTILIFWYNHKIKKAHTGGQYQFLEVGEQESLLEKAGFKVSLRSTPIYSNQAFLVKGYK